MRDSDPVYHIPVLLSEAMDGLNIRANGIFVDCTFGGGGHSTEILAHLNPDGRLFGFDQDADSKRNSLPDERFVFIPHNFRHIQRFLRLHGVTAVDGVLADLGVSSHQFDEPERGFSTRSDANLDMRMDKRQSLTAEIVLNTYGDQKLQDILSRYGEVTNAKTLAKAIVSLRAKTPFRTVNGFKQAVADLVKGNPNRWFAQVFQALRIEVNDETGRSAGVIGADTCFIETRRPNRCHQLSFPGRQDCETVFSAVVISKKKMNRIPSDCLPPKVLSRMLTKKPITPSAKELSLNPRARSAKLRIAEKI